MASIKAVLEESKKYGVPVHRVSQGTGIFLMTDSEIKDMLRIGRDNQMEVRPITPSPSPLPASAPAPWCRALGP